MTLGPPDVQAGRSRRSSGMSFSVDGWDPTYGTSLELEEDLGESSAEVDLGIEVPPDRWRPISPGPPVAPPCPVLFVDGVRRIEARVWIDDVRNGSPATDASAAICASYAAGVVCCCDAGAHFLSAETRRGLFTVAPHAEDIVTSAGPYAASFAKPDPKVPLSVTLSSALQARLADIELLVAVGAREQIDRTFACRRRSAGGGRAAAWPWPPAEGPRVHQESSRGLPADGSALDDRHVERRPTDARVQDGDKLGPALLVPATPLPAQRSLGRHRAGRMLPDLPVNEVVALANLSQVTLVRFASTEYKDARAPQNLYPIAGLERELRRRLGDSRLLYRALRVAASN